MRADRTDRPWPEPSWPAVLAMQWQALLFMHWPLPAAVLRPLIPPGLTLDTFDGWAWLGVVPFTMAGVHARFLPPLPGTTTFPELNVRTYVTTEGKAGVYFFSLDAANPLAVRAARLGFRLPYDDTTTRRCPHYDTTTRRCPPRGAAAPWLMRARARTTERHRPPSPRGTGRPAL